MLINRYVEFELKVSENVSKFKPVLISYKINASWLQYTKNER